MGWLPSQGRAPHREEVLGYPAEKGFIGANVENACRYLTTSSSSSQRTNLWLPVGLLHGLRALDRVQDLVALVDFETRLLLAGKAGGVFEIADDPAISEMQFRCEEELRHHASRNGQLSQRFHRVQTRIVGDPTQCRMS